MGEELVAGKLIGKLGTVFPIEHMTSSGLYKVILDFSLTIEMTFSKSKLTPTAHWFAASFVLKYEICLTTKQVKQ